MRGTILISFILIHILGWGQANYYRQYSSNGYDRANSVGQLSTSQLLVTGSSSSFADAPAQMYVLKLDIDGNRLWSRDFGGAEADGGNAIEILQDDSYFIGGYSQSSDSTSYNFAVWYFNADDELQWYKTYGTNGFDQILAIEKTNDNGLVLLGETNSTIDGFADILLIRIDNNGDELWRNQIENLGVNKGYVIRHLSGDDFLIGGEVHDDVLDRKSSLLIKINGLNGVVINQLQVNTGVSSQINDFYFTDPNYIFAIGEYVNNQGTGGAVWYKIEWSTGAVLTEELNGSNLDARGVGVTRFDDQMVAAVVHNGQYSHGFLDIDFHHCVDPFVWINSLAAINHLSNQVFGSIISVTGNGFVAVGTNEEWGTGGSSIFIIRKMPNTPFFQASGFNNWSPLVSIAEIDDTIKEMVLYPNPIQTVLNIDLPDGEFEVKVTDLNGSVIFELSIYGKQSIDFTHLPKGVYFFEVSDTKLNRKNLIKGVKL